MTKYEELIAEYENELFIEERPIRNTGLYADGVIWLNEKLPSTSKYCVLAGLKM